MAKKTKPQAETKIPYPGKIRDPIPEEGQENAQLLPEDRDIIPDPDEDDAPENSVEPPPPGEGP